ncbi:MAG: Oar protein [Acidobacteriaceae bacterium]|nr:Oar protein [Acidobacteriaceae bacterium]
MSSGRDVFATSLRLCALVAAVAIVVPSGVAQQTFGGITGTVTDSSGSVISGVSIKLVEEHTGLTREGKTNGSGEFLFADLPIGEYVLTYTSEGFATQRLPHIAVQGQRTATLNVQMKAGAASTTIEVQESPLMNAVDTTNGYILEKAQIESVPLPTGSFTGLAILSPGVNSELTGGTGANTGLGNAPIWANGQRDTSNSFLLNGVDASNLFNGKSTSQVTSGRVVLNTGEGNNGAGGVIQSSASVYLAIGQALPTPAPETLQELRVNASMYDAQQGASSGAHIDMSTSSGSNAVHASGYVNRGTDGLNAAPFFFKQDASIPANEKVPQLHRYTLGGTVGGPIIKDKLFGFVAYQHIHVADQEIGISRLTVPVGLSDDRSAGGMAALANQNFGTSLTAGQISPVALFLMQSPSLPGEPGKWLIPNDQGNTPTAADPYNASIPGTSRFVSDQAVADLDWNASAKDNISAKYYYQHDPTVAPYAYSNIPGFTEHLDAGSQVLALTNTLLLKPNLSTTQTFGFVREKVYGVNSQPFGPEQAGINTFGSAYFPGIDIVDVLGNGNAGGQNPSGLFDQALNVGPGVSQGPFTGAFQNRWMPSANAIWTMGKHNLTFGGSYSYTQLNARNERTNKGMIATENFAGFLAGNISYQNNNYTTTSFLLGDANRYYRANQVGMYLQDKYQVRSNLSLTFGLRYDWNGGLTEKEGRITNFDPSRYQFDEGGGQVISNGFVVAGNNKLFPTKGVSSTTLTGRQWGIAPRLGGAWQPQAFASKVVVRAGMGLYYDRGELFTYLSPGYAAGEVTGGPFGVTQAPPFVNAIQCPISPSFVSLCTPDASGGYTLSNPWGTTPGTAPSGNPADISKYLPSVANIQSGAQLFSFATYNRANKLPYSINYTFDVQWQPRNDVAVDIGYVGNLGRHQVIPVPFNQAGIASPGNPIHGQSYTYGYTVQQPSTPGFQYYNSNPANLPDGTPYLATYEGGNIDLRVPYIGYSAESETYTAAGISAYNALQTHVEKRMSRGLQVGFSYTYSHALDEQSAIGLFYNGNNPNNLRDGYASADFDRTHVINFNYVFQMPKVLSDSLMASKVINGWALQGITILQSGQPYSVVDFSGAVGSIFYGVADGITNPIVPLAPGCTPQRAKTGASGAFTQGTGKPALLASCFTLPLLSPGDLNGGIPTNDSYETNFTSGQRNIFRQSWQRRADVSLVKDLEFKERVNVRYSFDVFNLTDTTSFDIPIDNVTQNGGYNPYPIQGQPAAATGCGQGSNTTPSSFFNCPTGLGITTHAISSPRQIQMSLKLQF